VAKRVLQGGHEVPIRKIIDRWPRSIANAATVAPKVDRLYLYDNSVNGRDAQLVLRASEGRIAKQYARLIERETRAAEGDAAAFDRAHRSDAADGGQNVTSRPARRSSTDNRATFRAHRAGRQ